MPVRSNHKNIKEETGVEIEVAQSSMLQFRDDSDESVQKVTQNQNQSRITWANDERTALPNSNSVFNRYDRRQERPS